jgi:hypothetical protein
MMKEMLAKLQKMKKEYYGGVQDAHLTTQQCHWFVVLVVWNDETIANFNIVIQAEDSSYGSAAASSDMLTNFMARATNQATGLLAKATDRLGSMMMGKIHKHRATMVVENICEMRPGTDDDDYLYLDPRVKGDVDVASLRNNVARAPIEIWGWVLRRVSEFANGG